MTYFLCFNEGELVFASTNEDSVIEYKDNCSHTALVDACEECGRDIDDLTPEELQEISFMAGYDGGYYYMDSVDIDSINDVDESTEFLSKEDDIYTINDLRGVLEKDCDD